VSKEHFVLIKKKTYIPFITPVFFPRKFHGQRSLTGYSPCGQKELDTTEQLRAHTHCSNIGEIFFLTNFIGPKSTAS